MAWRLFAKSSALHFRHMSELTHHLSTQTLQPTIDPQQVANSGSEIIAAEDKMKYLECVLSFHLAMLA